MHTVRTHTALIVALLMTGPTAAADLAKGKALHDTVCKTCHQSDYYTRKNRKIHSNAELTKQVRGCQESAGENWSATQIDDVVAYLSATYYKFK